MIWLSIISIFLLMLVIWLFIRQENSKQKNQLLMQQNNNLTQDKTQLKNNFNSLQINNKNLDIRAAELKIQLTEKVHYYEEQIKFLKLSKETLGREFKQLAEEILTHKEEILTKESKNLLIPLEKQLEAFKNKIEHLNKEQSEERVRLSEQVKQLASANENTQKTAQNLSKALTFDNKMQGNWGEVLLSSILAHSGLREGYEFELQKRLTNDEGDIFYPDVVIHLPNNEDIIIDSKVSLKYYQDYVITSEKVQKEMLLKAHINAIKNHINGINLKAYENLKGVRTLDFIFVFMPIESALLVALEENQDLFSNAAKKNIILVSPSTLTMSLKIVHHIWQTEKQNKNAEEIARQAAAMYEKLHGFVKELTKVETHLDRAKGSYDEAYKKLSTGKGSLISRAEKFKQLGVSSAKQLP